MSRSFYWDYITSPEWRQRAEMAKARARYRCEGLLEERSQYRWEGQRTGRCPEWRSLQVHHLTYARLGQEHDEDLRVLCSTCHRAWHRLHG